MSNSCRCEGGRFYSEIVIADVNFRVKNFRSNEGQYVRRTCSAWIGNREEFYYKVGQIFDLLPTRAMPLPPFKSIEVKGRGARKVLQNEM